jgi:hypothetical protein
MNATELRQCAAWMDPDSDSGMIEKSLMKRLAAYLLAESKRLDERPYGCHCDLEPGEAPDGCVLDDNAPQNCVYAGLLVAQGRGKRDCGYWQPIEIRK